MTDVSGGHILKTKFIKKSSFFMVVFMALVTLSSTHSFAQEADTKPRLIPLTLNADTNNTQALDIAKKLNPDFFNIDEEYLGGSPDATFYAKFLPLDTEKPNRFLAVTVTETPYYCTTYGCPFYIYENHETNRWRLVASQQALAMWYDANTQTARPDNLISQSITSAVLTTSVLMWAGNRYVLVNR